MLSAQHRLLYKYDKRNLYYLYWHFFQSNCVLSRHHFTIFQQHHHHHKNTILPFHSLTHSLTLWSERIEIERERTNNKNQCPNIWEWLIFKISISFLYYEMKKVEWERIKKLIETLFIHIFINMKWCKQVFCLLIDNRTIFNKFICHQKNNVILSKFFSAIKIVFTIYCPPLAFVFNQKLFLLLTNNTNHRTIMRR